ncbi:MAG: CRISPR-associated endonuclease Cas3'' [Acidobacteria bacterium]|nr:CRISPR-associated endonuclease Cas3'' [Acidobacteriota bacterium]
MDSFRDFFQKLTGHNAPHDWQNELAAQEDCCNRLIRVPTGFGKTHGILAAWLWHRVKRRDNRWPRRLVWCLPMRVLVEQTENEALAALGSLGILWDGGTHEGKVGVHLLMGGADGGDWPLYPEECAVLIGTQDMLLSRAMNRGYAAARARWPMEFGLLNQDALWVMDEVQLMDFGLATSAQLQAFRDDDSEEKRSLRPCRTWWMSATLQRGWLEKSPDTTRLTAGLPSSSIPPQGRVGHLWDDVVKPCELKAVKDAKDIASLVVSEHEAMKRSTGATTLVVLNTVRRAVEVFELLQNDDSLAMTDKRLVHSRFRPAERASWCEAFLNREACASGTDRVIVATQVVEAGVDISAGLLVTELAPWASLVQRFGRCARWGGTARVIVADLPAGQAEETARKARAEQEKAIRSGKTKEIDAAAIITNAENKAALPYSMDELRAAREALGLVSDVAPRQLETFEEQHGEWLPRLYPFEPAHLLLRHELDELFDTSPDLSGAEIDISRFIRSGAERDLQVFWEDIEGKTEPPEKLRPAREALCTVPFLDARAWLCGKGTRLEKGRRAWVWDWLEGAWRRAEGRDFYPGQTVLVSADCGGYDPARGWDAKSSLSVLPVALVPPQPAEMTDSGQDDESLSRSAWQTIASHGREVGALTRRLAQELVPEFTDLFDLAGRFHDVGKSHAAFQQMIVGHGRPARVDLAKAPEKAWSMKNRRRGFRHELASALALFAVLQRHAPDHPALLGPWRGFLAAVGMKPVEPLSSGSPPTPVEAEILALSAESFNLLLYLVCSHHGKVRLAWHACPADQEFSDGALRIRGVIDGERLPALPLYTTVGDMSMLPESLLDLTPSSAGLNPRTGRGWTERVLSLLSIYGPFGLAGFEAIMRAADQRASMAVKDDELLEAEVSP